MFALQIITGLSCEFRLFHCWLWYCFILFHVRAFSNNLLLRFHLSIDCWTIDSQLITLYSGSILGILYNLPKSLLLRLRIPIDLSFIVRQASYLPHAWAKYIYWKLIIQVGPVRFWHAKYCHSPVFIIVGFLGTTRSFGSLLSFWTRH